MHSNLAFKILINTLWAKIYGRKNLFWKFFENWHTSANFHIDLCYLADFWRLATLWPLRSHWRATKSFKICINHLQSGRSYSDWPIIPHQSNDGFMEERYLAFKVINGFFRIWLFFGQKIGFFIIFHCLLLLIGS